MRPHVRRHFGDNLTQNKPDASKEFLNIIPDSRTFDAAEIDNETDERSMSCSASAVGRLVREQLVQDKC